MKRSDKEVMVEDLHGSFAEARHAVLVQPVGLTVEAVNGLRRQVRDSGGSYRVVKNRLALRAIAGTALEPLGEHFRGPTAVAQATDAPEALAKALTSFAKDHPQLVIKAGVVEGQVFPPEAIRELAEVPPLEELRATLLGVFQAPLRNLVQLASAPSRNLVTVLTRIAEKKESD